MSHSASGARQESYEMTIEASAERVWRILEDGARLPEWMTLVKATDAKRETLGAVRHCDVELAGRAGKVVERCVECVPGRTIAWRMESETLGMSKHFAEFGFGFELDPAGPHRTRVRTYTSYRPTGVVARLLDVLVLKRKYREVRRMALDGLRRLAEHE